MENQTKTVGVILERPGEHMYMKTVQNKIQGDLEVAKIHLQRHRIKILIIDQSEEDKADDVIAKRIFNQNKLDIS